MEGLQDGKGFDALCRDVLGAGELEHVAQCPECSRLVQTLDAEGVPGQALRKCPSCGATFWEED